MSNLVVAMGVQTLIIYLELRNLFDLTNMKDSTDVALLGYI